MKSANASSVRSVDGKVLEPEPRDYSGVVQVLQMTALSRIQSRTDLNRIDEIRGNITSEEGDLVVNGKNIDRVAACLICMRTSYYNTKRHPRSFYKVN